MPAWRCFDAFSGSYTRARRWKFHCQSVGQCTLPFDQQGMVALKVLRPLTNPRFYVLASS